jgi:membrane associated rhomboid family serine protease
VIPLRDANPTRRTPVVTIGLVAACLVAFAWELGLQVSGGDEALNVFITTWGVVPADLTAAWANNGFLSLETATLITSQFLHGGWLHLLGNLLFLWIFANNIEDDLGRLPFVLFYLGGGVAAGLTQVAIDPASAVPMIGASGAIAAVLGGYIVLYPRARITSLVFLGFFYQLIDVPAIVVLGFWFALQLIDGLASLGLAGTEGGVAIFAHIGGFVAGLIAARLLLALRGRRRGTGPPALTPVG